MESMNPFPLCVHTLTDFTSKTGNLESGTITGKSLINDIRIDSTFISNFFTDYEETAIQHSYIIILLYYIPMKL